MCVIQASTELFTHCLRTENQVYSKNCYHCPIIINKIQTAIYNTTAASTVLQNSGHGFLSSAAGGTQDWGSKRWDTLSVWVIPRNKWTFPGLRFNYAFPDWVDSHGLSSKCWLKKKATCFFRVEKCLFRATVTIKEGWEGATRQPASHSHLMKRAFWGQQHTCLLGIPLTQNAMPFTLPSLRNLFPLH